MRSRRLRKIAAKYASRQQRTLTPSENKLQRAVAEFLEKAVPLPAMWTGLDAGAGKMTKASAGDRKARGIQKGWPDFMVIAPKWRQEKRNVLGHVITGHHVIMIEMKSEDGRQTVDQVEIEQRAIGLAVTYAICRSVDEVQAVLVPHLTLTAHVFGRGILQDRP